MDEAKIIHEGKAQEKLDILAVIERGNRPMPITEQDRLTYVVDKIESECAICPYSAYIATKNNEIKVNTNFRGLSIEEAGSLDNYRHFKMTESNLRDAIVAKDDDKGKLNYLGTISDDIPMKSWNITVEDGGIMSFQRNAKWPGFIGYHRANSNLFGYAYFGYGNEIKDFCFQGDYDQTPKE